MVGGSADGRQRRRRVVVVFAPSGARSRRSPLADQCAAHNGANVDRAVTRRKLVVFVASTDRQSRLWVRPLNAVSAESLAGTENARFPFWSPDSRSVGFAADGQLKRVDLEIGAVHVLTSGGALGAAWNRDGTILFDRVAGPGLFRVSADGGERPEVLRGTAEGNDQWSPQFLPDHRHYLFYATGTAPGIYGGDLDTSESPRRILDAQSAAYASSGHLLFVRNGTLFAQAFDPVRLVLAGRPVVIAEHVVEDGRVGVTAALSASAAGSFVYRTGPSTAQNHFVWFDRSGTPQEAIPGSEDLMQPVARCHRMKVAWPCPAEMQHRQLTRDGQRFLMEARREVTIPITVVLNWKPKS